MDHDALHKNVANLIKFRTEAEEAIAFYKGMKATGGAVDVKGTMSEDDRSKIIDAVVSQLGGRLSDLEGRLKGLETRPEQPIELGAIEDRLGKLESAPAATIADADLAGRMEAMLTWFEANQEGLEILLGLDGEPDTADNAGTAAGAAGSVDGAGSAEAGPTEPGLPGASQDPSVAAEAVTDQTAAKSGV